MTLTPRPNYMAGRNEALDQAAGGGLGGTPQPPTIKADGVFTLEDENGLKVGEPQTRLDVIIVGANPHTSRVLWPPYQGKESNEQPICKSDNGVAPSADAQSPQHATCQGCPKAVFNKLNEVTGNMNAECQTRKKLACLVFGWQGVYLLSVPPASLKEYRAYLGELQRMNASVCEIVTRVALDGKILKFEAASWVPETLVPTVMHMVTSDEPKTVVNAFDKPFSPSPYTSGLQAITAKDMKQQRELAARASPYPTQPNPFPPPAPITITSGPAQLRAAGVAAIEKTLSERQFYPAVEQSLRADYDAVNITGGARVLNGSIPVEEPKKRGQGRPAGSRNKEKIVGPGPIASDVFTTVLTDADLNPVKFGVAPVTPPDPKTENLLAKAFSTKFDDIPF